MWLVCDCGYGFPKEARPRQEKINAICRQIVNFLIWQNCQQQRCLSDISWLEAADVADAAQSATKTPSDSAQSPPVKLARLLVVLGTGEEATESAASVSSDGNVTVDGPNSCCVGLAVAKPKPAQLGDYDNRCASRLDSVLLDRMKQVWDQEQLKLQKEAAADSVETRADVVPSFPDNQIVLTLDTLSTAIQRLQTGQAYRETAKNRPENEDEVVAGTVALSRLPEHFDGFNVDEDVAVENVDKCGRSLDSEPANGDQTASVEPLIGDTSNTDASNQTCADSCSHDNDCTHIAQSTSPLGVVYLSPDSEHVLDVSSLQPPNIVIVGMLIDRRTIQVNRSMRRAQAMTIPTVRWPLEDCLVGDFNDAAMAASPDSNDAETQVQFHPNEPLNVDCILEGMQQWDWNCQRHFAARMSDNNKSGTTQSSPLIAAIRQALWHHQQRHPERVRHKALDDDDNVKANGNRSTSSPDTIAHCLSQSTIKDI